MVLSVEQVIGYFNSQNNFDVRPTSDDREKDVDNIVIDRFYGNEIQLFDDLHIASIINNDQIYIYNISTVLFPWEKNHDTFRSPTISSMINISLPFIPTCSTSLFFDKYTSTLTISTSSNDGLLHVIDISVSGKYNYSLSVLSTRIFKTGLSNLTLTTQITDSLFFIGCESGFFLIILCKQVLSDDFLPLFSVEDLSMNTPDISTFLVVKRKVVDKNTENIYVITFSEKNKDLTLLLIEFNHVENNVLTTIIDRESDIKIKGTMGCPVLSLVENTNLFLLLVNGTIHLYKIINLDDCSSKNNINIQFLRCFDLGFEQNISKKDELIFSPQIHCNGSDIYIARAIFSENIRSYDAHFPIYEIRKICLNRYTSSIATINENDFNDPKIIWNQGAQNAYYNGLNYDELKHHIDSSNEECLDLENMINSLLNRIFEECPSNIVFDMAFLRYLRFLRNIILLNFGNETQHKLLNILNLTDKFRELTNLIKSIYINFEEDQISGRCDKYRECKFDREKVFCLIAPLLIFINHYKTIGNYCIRIFSNKGDTFLLSPISISTISSLSQEELNGIPSISSYGSNSFLHLPFYLVRNYLKFKYLALIVIIKASNMSTRRHLLELFNLYSKKERENKVVVLSIIFELVEVLSKKIGILNQIHKISKSKQDTLDNIDLMHYDILTQNFTLDEFKTLIQNINESFIYIASRSDDFVPKFIEKTFKANIIHDIKYSLNQSNNTNYKDIDTSNLELIELIKIKNIILILDVCSSVTRTIFKYLIWKQLTQNASSGYSCSFEHASHFFSEEDSFLNVGKYMATCKPNLINYIGGFESNITNCRGSKVYSISSVDQIYRVYKYYSSIDKFFTSNIFLNCTAKKLSLYIRSNCLFWESFLKDFCYNYSKYEDNIQLVELIYDYLENQIIDGCFDHNLVRYIFYLIKLIPYRKNTSKLSHLILNKLLNNTNLVDEIIELINPEVNDDWGIMLQEFSSSGIKVIYFISLIFQLFDQSKIKMYYNSIYINLLETSITLLYTSVSSCSQDQKILLNKIHRKYLIQYIYLSDNISDEKTIKLINKSLSCNSSKYDKILFLTTLWVKHNLSIKADNEGEFNFFVISSTLFGLELDEFYSLLIKIFWKKLHEFRSNCSGDSSDLASKNIITQSIYKFFLNKWKKEEKYQEIYTFAYLNALARYYDLISPSDRTNILFPENWFEFISRYEDQEMDSLNVLSEVFENLSGLFNYMSCENQSTHILESVNTIISSLNTYIIYSEIAISKKSTNKLYSYNPICIPNIFFGIKLPKIDSQENHLFAIHQKVTYLPSAAYISYLRWYFIGMKKLILSSSTGMEVFEYFNNNYGKYLGKYNSYLEYNGIYSKSVPNPQKLVSESIANILNISMMELNYYLVINGYFETAYRLTDIANQFLDNYLRVNDEILPINDNFMAFSNSLTQIKPENIYKTLGFWVFTYSLFLSKNEKYLNSLIEYKSDFLIQTSRHKKKKLSLDSPSSKTVIFEEMVLQNTKLSKTHKFDGTDYLAFSVNANFWNSILDRLHHSPHFLEGVHIALLINEDVYNTVGMNSSVENSYLSFLPSKLIRMYKEQEHLIKVIINYPIPNSQHLNVFMNIIENLVNFNFIEEAMKFIAILYDHVELPIYFVAKVRHMIRSSNKINNSAVFEEFESIIFRCISIGTLA